MATKNTNKRSSRLPSCRPRVLKGKGGKYKAFQCPPRGSDDETNEKGFRPEQNTQRKGKGGSAREQSVRTFYKTKGNSEKGNGNARLWASD